MKVTEHIDRASETLFSFEVIPPVKGRSIEELYRNIDPLMEFNPPFIDVTTSREEYVYIDRDGLLDKKRTRMRPGTLGICAAIKHKYDVDTIPHVLCGGFTREETEYLLVDCQYLGIDNIMALRGDAMKEEKYFTPTHGGHTYALPVWGEGEGGRVEVPVPPGAGRHRLTIAVAARPHGAVVVDRVVVEHPD